MDRFILNSKPQPNGDYEVHKLGYCNHLPSEQNRIYLGQFSDCFSAVAVAKIKYPRVASRIDGCYHCCNSCHTR